MTKFLFSALAAGLALSAATPAFSKEVRITVDLDGIDLTDPMDLQLAHERIEQAVERACYYGTKGIADRIAMEACSKDGMDKAMSELEVRTNMAVSDS